MSVAQSSRCLLCKSMPGHPQAPLRLAALRQFHTSSSRNARKPPFQNFRAVDLGLISPHQERSRRPRQPQPPKQSNQDKSPDKVYFPDTQSADRTVLGSSDAPARRSQSKAVQAVGKEAHSQSRGDLEAAKAAVEQDAKVFRPYTAREKQLLALKYSPQQLKALEAAEQAIDPHDLVLQGRMRGDPMRMEYKDDFSKIMPLIDFPVRAPDEDVDPGIRPLSVEETKARFAEWYQKMSERRAEDNQSRAGLAYEEQETLEDVRTAIDAAIYPGDGLSPEQRMAKLRSWAQQREGINDVAEFERFASDPSNFFHSPKGLLHSQSDALSDPMPKMEDPRINTAMESEEPAIERLVIQTGLSKRDMDKLKVKILVDHRVVNQTRLGKVQSQYYLAVAGNGEGLLGIGEGKSTEPAEGNLKARMNAIRNMKPIPRYEERTIFGEAEAKVGASIVKLSARSPGFGNRCQSLIFELARAAGIRDLSARCLRSRNKMNVVKAAYAALLSQKNPDDVAMARGRKMVDVRKVYYEGQVL